MKTICCMSKINMLVVVCGNGALTEGQIDGGAAGVIFDMCTTSALGPLAKPGFWEYASQSISPDQ